MSSRIDVEWLAFRAGLKPAIRLTGDAAEAAAMEARYRAWGAAVARYHRVISDGHGGTYPVEVVYVARSAPLAEALREVEVAQSDPEAPARGERMRALNEEMGRRLGYPPCCAASFAERSIQPDGPGAPADAFVAARSAWAAAPRWPLNDLLLDRRASVITFEPCSYACGAALSYAEALLRLIQRVDPRGRAALERVLRRSIVIGARGERAFAQVARSAGGATVSAAAPVDAADGAFAASLIGKASAGGGALGEDALLIDFGAPP